MLGPCRGLLNALPHRARRLLHATTFVQRGVRINKMLFSQFARAIFSRKNGTSADHGVLSFPAYGTKAHFITVADTSPASLLVPFLVKHCSAGGKSAAQGVAAQWHFERRPSRAHT